MAEFQDAEGREWRVVIDIPTVKVLREYDLDVLAMFDDGAKVFENIVSDPVKLVDTLWLICKEQADEQEVGEVDFARALVGDALMLAVHALVGSVCDFFPDPKRRESLRTVFRKIKETEAILLDNATAEIESLDVAEMAKVALSESGVKSGVSQDSSESTPASKGGH